MAGVQTLLLRAVQSSVTHHECKALGWTEAAEYFKARSIWLVARAICLIAIIKKIESLTPPEGLNKDSAGDRLLRAADNAGFMR